MYIFPKRTKHVPRQFKNRNLTFHATQLTAIINRFYHADHLRKAFFLRCTVECFEGKEMKAVFMNFAILNETLVFLLLTDELVLVLRN